MKIRTQDGRLFQGTARQIVQQMRDIAMMAAHLTFSEYIDFVVENTRKFEGIELRIAGETDDEKAASLVAEMIRAELCVPE